MSTARKEFTSETLWLCGKPRFMRETLGHVLKERFGAASVLEVHDAEPPQLEMPAQLCWLVWFLNDKYEIVAAAEKIQLAPAQLNLLLIQSDGHALVRWANGIQAHRRDVSLEELVSILQIPLHDRQTIINSSPNGGIQVSHWH